MPGLYIHVPFCVRKCKYCDFYSVPLDGATPRFLGALERELRQLPLDFAPDTVYIGGGTPTSMEPAALNQLVDLLKPVVARCRVIEWTCEANPGTLTREKADILKAAGVNRMSLGVQSFSAETLAFLGRIHSSAEAVDSYQLLRDAGFDNINVDLMYGIPGCSREDLEDDLGRVRQLAPEHIAAYCLIFEEGTPLTQMRDAGRLEELDDDEQLDQYRLVRADLGAAGYHHYEISNFAKPGFESRHNLLYWSAGEYIGCGPAAHSHWRGVRFGNPKSLEEYCAALEAGRAPRSFEEKLEPEAKAREMLIMGLRRLDGISVGEFRRTTGFDYRDLKPAEIDWLCHIGMLEEEDGRLRLTEKGLFVSDSVFAELV